MGRAPCCDKANVKKGPWSPEEDAKLKSYIEQHGTGGNWIALPQKIGLKRCGKSCRLRWLNYLRPNIKHGSFSEEEDNIICTLYVSIGSRWSIIAAQLPGRTDNDIKNYWNTRLKKKLLAKQRKLDQQPPVIPYCNWPSSSSSNSSSNSSSSSEQQLVLPPAPPSIHHYDFSGIRYSSSHEARDIISSFPQQHHLYPPTMNNNNTADATTSLNMYHHQQQGFESLTDDDFSHLMACVVNNHQEQQQMEGFYGSTSTESNTSWGPDMTSLVNYSSPPPLLSVSDYELGGGGCRQSVISHYQDDAAHAFQEEPASRYFGMQML